MLSPGRGARVENDGEDRGEAQGLASRMALFPDSPLPLPVEHGVEEAQRHARIRRALMLDQHADQRRNLFLPGVEGDAEDQVRLPLSPVFHQKGAVNRLDMAEVEVGRQVWDDGDQEVPEVTRILQQATDRAIRKVVKGRRIEEGHRRRVIGIGLHAGFYPE